MAQNCLIRCRSWGSPFKNSTNQPGKSEDNTLLNFNFNSKVLRRTSSSYCRTSYFLLIFTEFCGFGTLRMPVLFSTFLNAHKSRNHEWILHRKGLIRRKTRDQMRLPLNLYFLSTASVVSEHILPVLRQKNKSQIRCF